MPGTSNLVHVGGFTQKSYHQTCRNHIARRAFYKVVVLVHAVFH